MGHRAEAAHMEQLGFGTGTWSEFKALHVSEANPVPVLFQTIQEVKERIRTRKDAIPLHIAFRAFLKN